jgi:transcriptional regulator with XRE-family HTH domain
MSRQRISTRPLPPRKLPTECLCCGEPDPWVINKVEFTAPFRDAEHIFRAEVNQCRHCDAISTTEEQSAVISAQVRDAHRKWISDKLKKAQKELGLSLRELEEKTCIPFATLGRISSGDHLIEATIEKLLWMEIEKLRHAHTMESWLQMEQPVFRVTNGSVRIKTDPMQASLYARILKTAAQSPLVRSSDCEQADDFQNPSCINPVAA